MRAASRPEGLDEIEKARVLRPFKLRDTNDTELLAPSEWAVKDLMLEGEIVGIVAGSFVGKSTLIAPLACALRTGAEFFGHPAKKGRIIVFTAERDKGTAKRIKHLLKGRSEAVNILTPRDLDVDEEDHLDLLHPFFIFRLINAINRLEDDGEEPVVAVIIDTFAASMPSGNEGLTRDVGSAMRSLRKLADRGILVVIVHHNSRSTDDPTPRGTSAFEGAADRILGLKEDKKSGVLTLWVDKANSGPTGASVSFRRVVVGLGIFRKDKSEETTTILEVAEPDDERAQSPSAEERRANRVLEAFKAKGEDRIHRQEFLYELREAGIVTEASASEQLRTSLALLAKRGEIAYSSDAIWRPE